MTRIWAARMLIIVGALFYSSFLVELVSGYPLSPTRAFLSEIAALDQPTSTLVRTTDAIAGMCFFAAGVVWLLAGRRNAFSVVSAKRMKTSDATQSSSTTFHYQDAQLLNTSTETAPSPTSPNGPDTNRMKTSDATQTSTMLTSDGTATGSLPAVRPRHTWRSLLDVLKAHWRFVVCLGVLLTGVSTVLDSIFPMDCAEVNPACAARVAAGTVSMSHHIHAVTSSFAGTGIVVVAVGCVLAWIGNWSNTMNTTFGLAQSTFTSQAREARNRNSAQNSTLGLAEKKFPARLRTVHHHSSALNVALGLLACGVALSMGAQLLLLAIGWPIGIAQRVQVVLTVIMFIVVAFPLTADAHDRVEEVR